MFVVYGAAFPGKDNSTEPIPILLEVREHIWRDLGPFLHEEPLKILHILIFVLMDGPLQFRPHVFNRI